LEALGFVLEIWQKSQWNWLGVQAKFGMSADTLCRFTRTWSHCHGAEDVFVNFVGVAGHVSRRLWAWLFLGKAIVGLHARDRDCNGGGVGGTRTEIRSNQLTPRTTLLFFFQPCASRRKQPPEGTSAVASFNSTPPLQIDSLIHCSLHFQIFRNEHCQKPRSPSTRSEFPC
jgi:hypothetical protein